MAELCRARVDVVDALLLLMWPRCLDCAFAAAAAAAAAAVAAAAAADT